MLDEGTVDAMVADNGFAVAATLATIATSGAFADLVDVPDGLADGDDDTLPLTEVAVDAMVADNGYAQQSDLEALQGDVAGLPAPQWTSEGGSWSREYHS